MTYNESLEFLTRIGAQQGGPNRWTLPVGTTTICIRYDENARIEWRWKVHPNNNEVDECLAPNPRLALLDLSADFSDMATHCSRMGLAITRLAV